MDFSELQACDWIAWRAPSAHNTQPWQLTYGADSIDLSFDPKRHLAVSDPTRRDLLLSLGAFIEAMLITAAGHGHALDFTEAIDLRACRVGHFQRAASLYCTSFDANDLLRRQTSRLAYDGDRIDPNTVEHLRENLAPGMALTHVDGRDIIDILEAADTRLFGSAEVMRELRDWLRLNAVEGDSTGDGLTADCLGLSRTEAIALRALLRPGAQSWIRRLGIDRLLARQSVGLLRRPCSILVLSGPARAPSDLLLAGRVLLKLWLGLCRQGYYTHPLSQIIDYEPTCAVLAARIGLAKTDRIVSVFRGGRSSPPARSLRLRCAGIEG
jgi:hypothetical protein